MKILSLLDEITHVYQIIIASGSAPSLRQWFRTLLEAHRKLTLGVGSAASLWNCQLNPRSFPSLPRVAPERLGMQGFNNLLHAKMRRGALQKASPRT